MKTTNHEYYVSLEVAKLLKEAGFDWPTRYSYDLYLYSTEGEKRVIDGFASTFCNEHNVLASMPTLEVAQRWLREVHHLHITIFSSSQESWMFRITKQHQSLEDGVYEEDFYTYEEAQEAGIKKALELILEKGE